ncbi:MAG: dolichyl-phosphate beta-glucosyltransferase [Anaerolineales bacterium]
MPKPALTKPFLSLILPAHNEEHRLPKTLSQAYDFFQKQSYSVEIVVVENGSQDRTLELAQSFTQQIPYLHVIHEDRRGKGLAVKRGILEAKGEYRFIADVDFSMPIEEINRFIPPQLPELDVAIASREAPGAVRYNEPPYRHLTGRIFNTLVRLVALPGLQDTQCGFKCFRAAVAEDIFPYQTISGWTFDVEVLYIARLRGYRIVEIPIPWYFDANSKVRVMKDSIQMALDLLAIRRNHLRGFYAPEHQS